jgi:hypothetical protein
MSEADYDKGFAEGLLFVASLLRRSASIVETPTYSDFNRSDGGSFKAIAKVGSPHLAAKYREIARLLETATKESDHASPTH